MVIIRGTGVLLLYLFCHKSHYENVPFEIPGNWCWCTINDIAFVTKLAGFEYTKYIADNISKINDVPLFKGKNVLNGEVVYEFESYIPQHISDELFRSQISKKCLLTPYVGTIGNIGIHNKEGIYHLGSNVGKIELFNGLCVNVYEEYVKFYLLSSYGYKELTKQKKATAQESISIEAIREVLIPLPPVAEQLRIVNEIDNKLLYIKGINKDSGKISELIGIAKSKILDLAISGKLVPQDPDDEPAIELLKRINPDFKPCDNSHYENLPQGWAVCKIKDIFNITMGQSPTGESINGVEGIEFHQGKIHFTESYLSQSGVYTDQPTKIAEVDSLLLCVRAPVGVLNITQRKICIGRGLCALKPKYEIDNLYWLFILSAYKDYFESNATGSTFKAISGDTIKNADIKLPPLQEQERILSSIISLYKSLDAITAEL